MVTAECEVQKQRADEMKEIIMTRLVKLEEKMNHSNDGINKSEC